MTTRPPPKESSTSRAAKAPSIVSNSRPASTRRRRRRVDGPDHGPHEPRLDQVTVMVPHRAGRGAAEHDVELGGTKDEPVGLVDQDNVGVIAELVRAPGGQFQAAEPGLSTRIRRACAPSSPLEWSRRQSPAQDGCGTIRM